jgi:hypothetical protein
MAIKNKTTPLVQFMGANGDWRKSGYHVNNLVKNYTLQRETRFWNYYVGHNMIYRVFNADEVREMLAEVEEELAAELDAHYGCMIMDRNRKYLQTLTDRKQKFKLLINNGVLQC